MERRALLRGKIQESHTLMAVTDNQAGDFVNLYDIRGSAPVLRSHGVLNVAGNQRALDISPNGKWFLHGGTATGNPLSILYNWDYTTPLYNVPAGLGDTRRDFAWYDEDTFYSLNGVTSYAIDVWNVAGAAASFETAATGYILEDLHITDDKLCLVAVGRTSPYVEVYNLFTNPLQPALMARPAGPRMSIGSAQWKNSVYVWDRGSNAVYRYVRSGSGAAATMVVSGPVVSGITTGGSLVGGFSISRNGVMMVCTGEHATQANFYQLAADGASAAFMFSLGTTASLPPSSTRYNDIHMSDDAKWVAGYGNAGTGTMERCHLYNISSGTPVKVALPGATTGRPWQKIRFSRGVI